MWKTYLCLLLIFGLYDTFAKKIVKPTIVSSKSKKSSTSPKPSPSNCRCVAIESCPPDMKLDPRIVNQGTESPCLTGEIWCCQDIPPLPPCGTKRIKDAPAQPPGTAKYGDYPWQAAIISTNNTYLGSGVLIDTNHVLTVAHKVEPYLKSKFKIRLGDWDIRATDEQFPHQDYQSTKVFVHPDYNSKNYINDIAIVRLNASVPLTTSLNINTACLPTKPPVAGSRCYVAGWGANAFGPSGMYQRILRDVDVPIINQTTCEARLRATRLGTHFVLDENSFMCAGGELGKDSCEGDGGAPLMCLDEKGGPWYAVGLVAWGIGCADESVPGVYINIHNYLPWIKKTLIAT
ncbi:hypothetical protein PV327_010868 [Microctonus hyperodae]|uniref:Peptidase S1 domain-containing protein n=1 Tax=Microctonus hyperodae TaxID=165561 RepID=A0AA39F1F5_MICHY|nr:hypothetical protein PV327_010868 [Microctonus hyperodae]